MGITERKEREKAEMRQRIIDAGRHMLLEEGYEQTSIRKIAKHIEYSPGTIYLYFKNKDELFFAIHEEAFRQMNKQMAHAMKHEHPVERLNALGEAYLTFAFDNPELYDLMFVEESPMNIVEEMAWQVEGEDSLAAGKWEAVSEAFGILYTTVQACIEEGHFPHQDLNTITFAIWSMMHGMVTLVIKRRLDMIYPQVDKQALMRQVMSMTTKMLQKPN
ncbi:MAG: TetR/AcrR family transcriptional regulator [Bacteroidota bacterium]